jgi:hypothetical protein
MKHVPERWRRDPYVEEIGVRQVGSDETRGYEEPAVDSCGRWCERKLRERDAKQ